MIGAICHQLIAKATPAQMRDAGMDVDYVNHGLGIHPSGAGGMPWTATYIQSKGDPITDLYENMAADEKLNWHNQDENKPAHFLIASRNEKDKIACAILSFSILWCHSEINKSKSSLVIAPLVDFRKSGRSC